VEASALQHAARLPALAGRSPLLRLQGDERLVALIRRGHHAAFETLVQRYHLRLLAFCRHMLGSQEDAEDVLQEVFAAAFNAICADERPINARPWLYRIARNRCLNHLRRPQPAGQDSMDVFERDGGTTTADTVHKREEFRHIVSDVQELPESQRTALLLREIDALSYDQIAEAMDTTVPSVKSLLVRARVALAEAAEARLLTCEEVRLELGQVAEGLAKPSPPVRRHLRSCERCRIFRSELRRTTRALAAIYPVGPLVVLKKLALAKLGFSGASTGGAAAGGGGAAAGGATAAGTAASTAAAGSAATTAAGSAATAGGITAGGAVSAGVGTIATKAAAATAAAVLVTGAAVEVKQITRPTTRAPRAAITRPAPPRHVTAPDLKPKPAPPKPVPAKPAPAKPAPPALTGGKAAPPAAPAPVATANPPAPARPVHEPQAPTQPQPKPPAVQEESSTVTLPRRHPDDTAALPPLDGGTAAPPTPTTPPVQPPPTTPTTATEPVEPPTGDPKPTTTSTSPAP
jgi:RNA polymerase sigma factor (sigma-70 family)